MSAFTSEIWPDDPLDVLDKSSDFSQMHGAFNSGSSSRRLFSEVHYYRRADPDLTIGMGHWTRSNIAALFAQMKSDRAVWDFMTSEWASVLSKINLWAQFAAETGRTGDSAQALSDGLDHILCAASSSSRCVKQRLEPWADRVGERFNSPGHWFHDGWKATSRVRPIATHQLKFWRTSVLEPGASAAAERLVIPRGGVASVISAKSSGLGNRMFKVGAKNVSASGAGVSRRWSLEKVPAAAQPDSSTAISSEQLLQDWRALVAWQYYSIKAGRVRSRMRAIWKLYHEQSWGPLKHPSSLSKSTSVPKHAGRPMDRSPFDFSLALADGTIAS